MNNLYLTNLPADKNTISRQNIKNNCFVAWKSHKKQAKTEGRLIDLNLFLYLLYIF